VKKCPPDCTVDDGISYISSIYIYIYIPITVYGIHMYIYIYTRKIIAKTLLELYTYVCVCTHTGLMIMFAARHTVAIQTAQYSMGGIYIASRWCLVAKPVYCNALYRWWLNSQDTLLSTTAICQHFSVKPSFASISTWQRFCQQ